MQSAIHQGCWIAICKIKTIATVNLLLSQTKAARKFLDLTRFLFFTTVGTLLAKKLKIAAACGKKIKTQSIVNDMSTLTAKGNWNIAKGKLKQKFAQLTDDDLQFTEGKEDELLGRIQKRTGRGKDKVKDTLKECRSCKH